MTVKAKTLIIIALLITVFGIFGLISYAEEPEAILTVKDVDSLTYAIQRSTATYVKLDADITVDEPIIVKRDNITIDLNGHTITAYQSENNYIFNLQLEGIKFKITGSGFFNTSKTIIFNASKKADIKVSATGAGINITSPDTCEYPYFKLGNGQDIPATMSLSGRLYILHTSASAAFEIYKSSVLNITDAEISNGINSDLFHNENTGLPYLFRLSNTATLNINNSRITSDNSHILNQTNAKLGSYASNILINSTSLYVSNGNIINSNSAYSNITFNNCDLKYSNCAFNDTTAHTTIVNYFLNISLNNTNSTFTGNTTEESVFLKGKGITAILDSGFHNLNGANLAIDTTPYNSAKQSGVLIKTGTAISCDFSDNRSVAVENKNVEIAKWYDKNKDDKNLIAIGYYDSAQEAKLDTSVLPVVTVDGKDYNLRYSSWVINCLGKICEFTPDASTMIPIPALNGIKYNLSTYTNFSMNVYLPTAKDIIGGYWDASCSYPIESTSYKIDGADYLKYSFQFGASDMDSIVMYVKYNAEYKNVNYQLTQKIEVSVIDYTEAVLSDNTFSETEKRLAADMLRYCSETVKLANGRYNSYANVILEEYSEYLTNLNTLEIKNTDTDTSKLSYYIEEAMFLFDTYEPKFAFRYTENITSPSSEASDGCICLNVSYISLEGDPKHAKIEVDTDNKIFYTSEISAYDIDELFTIKIYSSDLQPSIAEGTFSLGAYISALESTSTDITFAKALYAYSLSAEEYKRIK